MKAMKALAAAALCAAMGVGMLWGNGGPFVIKYPEGDPSAKGTLARLDDNLRPGRIENLRVVKEDLSLTFGPSPFNRDQPPLVAVQAAYTIENPTDQAVTIDFGFPILRGIYTEPLSMMPRPDVHVLVDGKETGCAVISNSVIYGIIRQRSKETIEKGIAADETLAALAAALRKGADDRVNRAALTAHLTDVKKWNERDIALFVEYLPLTLEAPAFPPELSRGDTSLYAYMRSNMGLLQGIGEQKATQFLAHLSSLFDAKAPATYEAIFEAWGGDVRQRSVDLATGKIRPREMTGNEPRPFVAPGTDPSVYARVDYLEGSGLKEDQKEACRRILKNLPVIFTFAPMNLLHYRVEFPAKRTKVVTVQYQQYAYIDSADPASYQIAYVVHPASMWKEFGPIHLSVNVPQGLEPKASVALEPGPTPAAMAPAGPRTQMTKVVPMASFIGEVKEKTGEIFIAIPQKGWWPAIDAAPAQKAAGAGQ